MLSVVQSGINWNSSKYIILCIFFLSASLKRIRPIATEKQWRHHFLDIQGQLALYSVVESGRSNSKTSKPYGCPCYMQE